MGFKIADQRANDVEVEPDVRVVSAVVVQVVFVVIFVVVPLCW